MTASTRPLSSSSTVQPTDDFASFFIIESALSVLHNAFLKALEGHPSLEIYKDLYEKNQSYLQKVEKDSDLREEFYTEEYQKDIALWLPTRIKQVKGAEGTDRRKEKLFIQINEVYEAMIKIKVRMKIAGVVKNTKEPVDELVSNYQELLRTNKIEESNTLNVDTLLSNHQMVKEYQRQLARECQEFENKNFTSSQTDTLENIDREIERITSLKIKIVTEVKTTGEDLLLQAPLWAKKKRHFAKINALHQSLRDLLERIENLNKHLTDINKLAEYKEESFFLTAEKLVEEVASVAKTQCQEKTFIGTQNLTPWNDPSASDSVPQACSHLKSAISTAKSYFGATTQNETPNRLHELASLRLTVTKHSQELQKKSRIIGQELNNEKLAHDMLDQFTSIKKQAKTEAERALAAKKQEYLNQLNAKRTSLLAVKKRPQSPVVTTPIPVVTPEHSQRPAAPSTESVVKIPEEEKNAKEETPNKPRSVTQKLLNLVTGKYAVGTSTVVGGTATGLAIAAFIDFTALAFITTNPVGLGIVLGATIALSGAVVARNAYHYYKEYKKNKLFKKLDEPEKTEFINTYESYKNEGYDTSTLRLMVKLRLRPDPKAYGATKSNEVICHIGHKNDEYRQNRVPRIVLDKDAKKLYFLTEIGKVPITANNKKGFIKQIKKVEEDLAANQNRRLL